MRAFLCLLLLLAGGLADRAAAVDVAPPPLLTCQGRLDQPAGTAETGTHTFAFAILAPGNTVLWSVSGLSLSLSDGLYSAVLGDTSVSGMTAIPARILSQPGLTLQITADGTILSPNVAIIPAVQASLAFAVADGSIGTSALQTGAVGSSQIAAGAVGMAQLAAAAVHTAQLANGAVRTNKIAVGAVGTAQLAAGAVGAGQLAPGAVGTPQLAAGAVGAGQLAAGAVGTGQLAAGAVGTPQLQPGSVNLSILDSGLAEEITPKVRIITSWTGSLTILPTDQNGSVVALCGSQSDLSAAVSITFPAASSFPAGGVVRLRFHSTSTSSPAVVYSTLPTATP